MSLEHASHFEHSQGLVTSEKNMSLALTLQLLQIGVKLYAFGENISAKCDWQTLQVVLRATIYDLNGENDHNHLKGMCVKNVFQKTNQIIMRNIIVLLRKEPAYALCSILSKEPASKPSETMLPLTLVLFFTAHILLNDFNESISYLIRGNKLFIK